MNPGWVYILTNKSLQSDYLKIGRTTNDPSVRASEISSVTGVATPFKVAYCEAVPDCVRAESLIHQKLNHYRINSNREFFRIEFAIAQNNIQEICEIVRNESSFCHHCKAKKAERELCQIQEELRKYQKKLKHIQRRISFFAFCRNYLSRFFSVLEGIFRKIVPTQFDRKIYFWGCFVPISFAGWIILVGIFPEAATALMVTALLFSALMVMSGAWLDIKNESTDNKSDD